MSTPPRTPHIVQASDHSMLVVFGDEITLEAHEQVLKLMTALKRGGHAFIRNLHPAYSSLLVSVDPVAAPPRDIAALLERHLANLSEVSTDPPRRIAVPVCYGGALGPDLAAVAEQHGMSQEQVIALHSAPEYRVFFLGFSPGFPYLGGLPPELATPRLPTPRSSVPAGSVAIAGSQAGIYPSTSPGGWRILGRTPLRLFTPTAPDPVLLRPGDRLRFIPISAEQFSAIE